MEVVTRAFRRTRKTSLCSRPRESSLFAVRSTSLRDAYQSSQLAAIAPRRGVPSLSIAGRHVAPPVTTISNSAPIGWAAWWSTAPAAIARLWSGAAAVAKRPRSRRTEQRSGVGNRGNGRRAAPQLHVSRDAGQWTLRPGDDCGQDAEVSDSGAGR